MRLVLELDEAVPLGYAVLAQVAEDVGARMLAIKGPVLSMQGLRPPKQSVDIDVLVHPHDFAALTAGLTRVGWRDDHVYETPTLVPQHSVNHRHPHWPLEVDVHHWFPGFLADAAVVFDELWARRVEVELAHRSVAALDPVAHAALAALHYLRDEGRSLRSADVEALAVVVETSWTDRMLHELVGLAARTGASEPLRPFLTRLGLPTTASTASLAVSLTDWRLRTESTVTEVLPWLIALERQPWRRRPGFVAHALWPDARQLQGVDPADPPRGRALALARWSRLLRGLHALPAARADARRLRRAHGD